MFYMQISWSGIYYYYLWLVANFSVNKRKRKQNSGINCKRVALCMLEKLNFLCVQFKQKKFLRGLPCSPLFFTHDLSPEADTEPCHWKALSNYITLTSTKLI